MFEVWFCFFKLWPLPISVWPREHCVLFSFVADCMPQFRFTRETVKILQEVSENTCSSTVCWFLGSRAAKKVQGSIACTCTINIYQIVQYHQHLSTVSRHPRVWRHDSNMFYQNYPGNKNMSSMQVVEHTWKLHEPDWKGGELTTEDRLLLSLFLICNQVLFIECSNIVSCTCLTFTAPLLKKKKKKHNQPICMWDEQPHPWIPQSWPPH